MFLSVTSGLQIVVNPLYLHSLISMEISVRSYHFNCHFFSLRLFGVAELASLFLTLGMHQIVHLASRKVFIVAPMVLFIYIYIYVFSLLSSLALNILRVSVSTSSAQVQHFKRTPSDLKSWSLCAGLNLST